MTGGIGGIIGGMNIVVVSWARAVVVVLEVAVVVEVVNA